MITPAGDVQPIGGIQEKISAAQKAGATAFLVPTSNCRDLDGVRTTMTLIKVGTLGEAIKAVEALNSNGDAAVLPHC
jgi:PDZ domain-containing protein